MPNRTDVPHQVRIPIRLLEAFYGKDNFDDAGDDLAALLTSFVGRPFTLDFRFETSHANPWFHEVVVHVAGIDADEAAHLTMLLQRRGLIEAV